MLAVLEGAIKVAEAQRRFPYWVFWLAGALLVAWAIGSTLHAFPWQDSRSAPAVQPEQQVNTAPVENPPAQNTQSEVAAPIAPVVVDYRVTWAEVRDFDPSTIPVEQGIYDASYSWAGKGGYGEKILPHLEGLPVAVAATRDAYNKDVVLASLDADRYGPYLLLSVDREKSWCRLNLIPITWEGQATNGVTPEEVRIVASDEKIRLYGRYALGAGPDHLYWWKTVVNKSELPCS